MADIFDENDEPGDVIDVGEQVAPEVGTVPPPGPRLRLRAEWDAQGRCWVAQFAGDKQLENWRPPTKDEWDALRARGVLTRPSPAAPASGLGGLVDTVKDNAVPFVLGAGTLWFALRFFAQKSAAKLEAEEAAVADMSDDED